MKLRFLPERIGYLAERYQHADQESALRALSARCRSAKYFSKPDFVALCRWKSPRIVPRSLENSEELIREVTHAALTSKCEEFRIKAPTLLRGVSFPVASTLLHFGHADPYPILDFRALWSLGCELDRCRDFNFNFWWTYVEFCRKLSKDCGVPIRVLDRALWQYSKENQ